jgi:hypothetical protein
MREMQRKIPKMPEYVLQRYKESQKELIERAETHLNLLQRGFHVSFQAEESINIIFDSEWCRLDISQQHPSQNIRDDILYVSYGRLHAPNEEAYMMLNGEKYHCWHETRFLCLFFLDGSSPYDVESEFDSVPLIKKYRESEEGSRLRSEYPSEFGLRLQALIWEQYGQRLFDLFDLRRPDLWDAYRDFLEKFFKHKNWHPFSKIKGMPPAVPPWKIC